MKSVVLWTAVAAGLPAATALQILVVVLNLTGGSRVPVSTLSGIATLILGIYAITHVRRIRHAQTTR